MPVTDRPEQVRGEAKDNLAYSKAQTFKGNSLKRWRSVRKRFAVLFVTAVASVCSLPACGGEAKEDPAEEQQREVQQRVEQPEQTQSTVGEQTDRTVGENIQG